MTEKGEEIGEGRKKRERAREREHAKLWNMDLGGGGGEYTYVYIFGVDPALRKGRRLPVPNIPADEWENQSAWGEKSIGRMQ